MDNILKRTIVVVPYDPEWKNEFQKIKSMLLPHIGDLILDIVHIGSTSVEGLSAKPIVDFNIVMDSYNIFPALRKRLEELGYEYEGNGGITGRERFKRTYKDEFITYHMYVCPKDSHEHMRNIIFRDYLRTHPVEADKYAQLKIQLAEQFRHDINSYTGSKHEFIEDILLKAKAIK